MKPARFACLLLALLCGCSRSAPPVARLLARFGAEPPAALEVKNYPAFLMAYGGAVEKLVASGKADAALAAAGRELPPRDALRLRLLADRARKDSAAFARDAEAFLAIERDETIAIGAAEHYAGIRDLRAFTALGTRYANGGAPELLMFAEIARNAGWSEASIQFASAAAASGSLNYATAFRSAQFLAGDGALDAASAALDRARPLAGKGYQQEDVELLRCRISILRGVAGEPDRALLFALSRSAIMPQVRRDAADLLRKIR